MKCEECELLLAEGGMDASVEHHLSGCVACRALQEELQANALALSSLRDDELPMVPTPVRRRALPRPVPWIAAAAAAAVLVLIARQGLQRQSQHPQPVPAHVTVTAKLPARSGPVPTLLVRRRKPKSVPRIAPPAEPLLVKMLTPDPDVVVYWIVD
jgi:hypothetical protein